VKWIHWPYVSGSNSMVRSMGWRSITNKLDAMNLVYEEVPRQHVVCMSDEDFVLFCLKWKPNRNLRFLEWQVINPPDAQV
jgi:hypothetical protein